MKPKTPCLQVSFPKFQIQYFEVLIRVGDLRLGLGKDRDCHGGGSFLEFIGKEVLFVKDKHIWSQITWSVHVQN